MTTTRPLTPLSSEAIESMIPRLRGRTPIPPDTVRLSVLIPVYNEEATLRLIVEREMPLARSTKRPFATA